MAKPKEQPVVVKKVKPYPIAAEVTIGAQKKPTEIIYLGTAGVIIKVNTMIMHVGEFYQISFNLPVSNEHFEALQVRVLKTYDKSIDPKKLKVERLAEFHFQSLTKEQRKSIVAFIAAIGQDR
jgi:DNA-binding cell septation regulator SpoVG